MCFVATNPAISLEFESNPLCYYALSFWTSTERLRSHPLILLSSTAESSLTSSYVVVPERFGQNEEPAASNKERARKKPSLVSEVDLINAVVIPSVYL